MKILVTGGAGFIGTNLIINLLKEGHEVTSIDNYDSGFKSNHQKGCKYLEKDIKDIFDIKERFDLIFHLAGLSRIQPSFKNPLSTFFANSQGTQYVCEFARNIDAKIVYSGSSSRWHNPYISPYACYKHIGEEICKMYRESFNLKIEIARFYNVYGPYEIIDGDWAAVIGIWRGQIRDGKKITIIGDGNQRRDFTHVDDIIDGLYKIGLGNETHHDAWELGTGMNYSINEVYNLFKERFNVDCIFLENQPGNYRETLRENDDSLQRLNWKPKDRLSEYIKSL